MENGDLVMCEERFTVTNAGQAELVAQGYNIVPLYKEMYTVHDTFVRNRKKFLILEELICVINDNEYHIAWPIEGFTLIPALSVDQLIQSLPPQVTLQR